MKLLFIACYSPLINNSAAIETLQYLNKLSDIEGNEVHLLTVNFPKDCFYYDKELLSMLSKNIRVHLIEGGLIFKKLLPKKKNIKTSSKSDNTNGNLKKVLRKVKNAVVIPDMYYGWSRKAYKYGINLVRKENIDTIFSMHEPPSSHLCAYKIKEKFKEISWTTYWSDPWLKDSTRQKSFFLKKLIEKKMERKIVSLSDRFIFVTQSNRLDYINDYTKLNENNTFLINRGFDNSLYKKLESEKVPELIDNRKINIIYTGEIFSKLRNINPFVNALKEIEEESLDDYEKFNVLFFGNIDDIEAKKKLEELKIVKVSPRIPFNEALKYMLNGDILLLFGNKNSKQIPAKIYDYFGAKGKILVIYGDENDPIRKITECNNKCICSSNLTEKIKKCLYEILNKYNNKELKGNPDFKYEWNSIVYKLNDILRGDD